LAATFFAWGPVIPGPGWTPASRQRYHGDKRDPVPGSILGGWPCCALGKQSLPGKVSSAAP